MQKTMEAIAVRTENGSIVMEQDKFVDEGTEAQTISLNPEQIPLLITWLQEAATDLATSIKLTAHKL